MNMNTIIALSALIVSVIALGISICFWLKQFRPIVTAAVRTAKAGSEVIAYNLVILNSGTIPTRNIRLKVDESSLRAAFGKDRATDNEERWIRLLLT